MAHAFLAHALFCGVSIIWLLPEVLPEKLLFSIIFYNEDNVVAIFNIVVPDILNDVLILGLLWFIIILLVSLILQTKAPFPAAFKFKFPVPLVEIVIGLFGIEASNSGKNDEEYTFCFAVKCLQK